MPLNLDEQRIRLKAIAEEDWTEQAKQRLTQSPKRLRPIGASLLPGAFHDITDWTHRQEIWRQASMAFAGLKAADRREVLSALHPELAVDLENLWLSLTEAPYQTGLTRRGFRAPQDSEVAQHNRFRVLTNVVASVGPYRRDIEWIAIWGSGIGFTQLGPLLAVAVDHNKSKGDAVFENLMQTVRGEHEIAVVHHSAISALLTSSRPEGWELVEGLLLAAQRQEGLRQSILEQADMGQIGAFIRLMQVVLDNNLLRFAAAIRAAGVWVGLPFDVEHEAQAKLAVERLFGALSDPETRDSALASDDPMQIYCALIAIAIRDVSEGVRRADQLVDELTVEGRIAVTHFLSAVRTRAANEVLARMLDDADLGVATSAYSCVSRSLVGHGPRAENSLDAMGPLMRLVDRAPATVKVPAVLFGGDPHQVTRSTMLETAIGHHRGDPDLFVPYFDDLSADGRRQLALRCKGLDAVSPAVRQLLLQTVGGRGTYATSAAVTALTELGLEPDDAPALESLLTRKATKLRNSVVTLLSTLDDAAQTESAARLWDGKKSQRDAACELIAEVDTPQARELRSAWASAATEYQRDLLGAADEDADQYMLYKPDERTPAVQPSGIKKPKPLVNKAAARLVDGLDDLAHKHRDVEVVFSNWQGEQTVLLGDMYWFPHVLHPDEVKAGVERDMILGETVRAWWDKRPKTMRDEEGTEAVRALLALSGGQYPGTEQMLGYSIETMRQVGAVRHWLAWLTHESPAAVPADDFVRASEYLAQEITAEQIDELRKLTSRYHRSHGDPCAPAHNSGWMNLLLSSSDELDDEIVERLWRLERWLVEPFPGAQPMDRGLHWAESAFLRGRAKEADVYWALDLNKYLLRLRTARRPEGDPKLLELADRLRDSVVQAELARGDKPMPTSDYVRQVGSIEGAELAMQLVARMSDVTWSRGYAWGTDKKGTISHLIRVSYPAAADTAVVLAAAAKSHGVSNKELVEFGVYAPQWAPLVEEALGWDGFEDAVWWIHSHTKDTGWSVGRELRETWAAMSAERTPLTGEDLLDGAVDIEWFWRVRHALGAKRWKQVYDAGKYASSGAGHRRAQLFADVLLGQSKESEIIKRIEAKRHQDSVRALGLLPLPKAQKTRAKAQLKRYQVLREFQRGSRKFGSQRQASERTAMRIGMENLARNAGYRDPARFSWAMEADELADLADGPIVVTRGDLNVSLSVNELGVAELNVDRAGKPLKQVPTKVRKDPEIADLRDRKTQLGRQVSRVRASLETAMINSDSFSVAELDDLRRHPVVRPMLQSLVLVDRSGKCIRHDGERFVSAANRTVKPSAKGDGELRIAHPVDLLASKRWGDWQARCFVDGIAQPFKQVFRELYVPTKMELTGKPMSERYAGHQVQPSQSRALFTARAWHTHHDDYVVTKTFHSEEMVARLELDGGFFNPADVELPVLHGLWFSRRGEGKALPIKSVPPVMFSEVMRDLDLVVSVAHAGGVDPEASESTVEMRASLVRETAAVMGLTNISHVGDHVVIEGKLGEYSLHLGSGTVHRRPGGQVCVVPVHAQRRGRLFLPFADDDPRTAEVLSKLLLFARDDQIQDPTILEQLRG